MDCFNCCGTGWCFCSDCRRVRAPSTRSHTLSSQYERSGQPCGLSLSSWCDGLFSYQSLYRMTSRIGREEAKSATHSEHKIYAPFTIGIAIYRQQQSLYPRLEWSGDNTSKQYYSYSSIQYAYCGRITWCQRVPRTLTVVVVIMLLWLIASSLLYRTLLALQPNQKLASIPLFFFHAQRTAFGTKSRTQSQ